MNVTWLDTAPYTECPVLLRHPPHLLQRPLCSGGGPLKHLRFLAYLAIQCAKIRAWVCKNYQIPLLHSQPHPHQGGTIKTAKTVPTRKGSLAPLSKDSSLSPVSPDRATDIKIQPLPQWVLHPPPPLQASLNASHLSCLPLPWLLLLPLQGHFYATRGHHVALALLSFLSPPPYPLHSRIHSYVPSTEGSEFLTLCILGLPKCLVLSGSPNPPQQQHWEETPARWSLVPIPEPPSFAPTPFSPRSRSQLTFLHWDLMLRPGSWTRAAWQAERGVVGSFRATGAWAAPVKEVDPQAELLLPGRGLQGQRQTETKEGGREEDKPKRGRGKGSRARVLNSERARVEGGERAE